MCSAIRQQLICCFIDTYTCQRGFPPTWREIMDWTGISSTGSVSWHLCRLVRLGYLRQYPRRVRRSVCLTDAGKAIAARWRLEVVA